MGQILAALLSVYTPVGIPRGIMEEVLAFACGRAAEEGLLTSDEDKCVGGLSEFLPPRLPVFFGGMTGISSLVCSLEDKTRRAVTFVGRRVEVLGEIDFH